MLFLKLSKILKVIDENFVIFEQLYSYFALNSEKNHTEFRAKYEYTCSNITEFSSITFNIFDSFKNSKDLELNVIGTKSTTKHKINKFTKKLSLYNFSN